MITMLNHGSKKQTILLEQAWDYLKSLPESDGGLTAKDIEASNLYGKNSFSDLAHYFAYLPALIEHSPKYLMLPTDEAPFYINANERTIKVPKEFEKCSGVQSDNFAEIITFTVDRYFDYKDLAEAKIAVQWINEAAKKEGVSFIDLIDLETYGPENMIRFGWPLTADMTAAAGNLRFAVRFYTAQEVDGALTFNYLLNTTPASISIKPTLAVNIDGENVIKNNNDYAIFLNTVTRSQHPSYAIPTPVVFKDAPKSVEAIVLRTNTLELEAEATTADGNPIRYDWYYLAPGFRPYVPYDENGEEAEWPSIRPAATFYKENENYEEGSKDPLKKNKYVVYTEAWPTEKPDESILVLYVENPIRKIQDNDDFSISLDFRAYAPDTWPTSRPGDISFWIQNDEAPNGYSRYGINEEWPIYVTTAEEKERLEQEAGHEVLTTLDITLYTYKSVLKFEATNTDVTGKYFVRGINSNEKNSVFTDAPADYCSILAPLDIKITKNLADTQAFSANADLKIEIEKDGGNPLKTYELYKGTEKRESLVRVPANNASFTLTDSPEDRVFGSYQIKVISELNRGVKEQMSEICTVYDDPLVPDCDLYAKKLASIDSTEGENIEDYNEDPIKKAFVLDSRDSAGIYKLIVDTDSWTTANTNGYNIGDLIYKWTVQLEGSQEQEIEAPKNPMSGLIGSTNVNTNSLIIRTPEIEGVVSKPVYTYRCIVTNKLPTASAGPVIFTFSVI